MSAEYTEESLNQLSVDQLRQIILRNRYLDAEEDDKQSIIQSIINPIKLISSVTLNDLSHANVVINVKINDTRVQLPEILRMLRQSADLNNRSNIKLCINEIYQPISSPPSNPAFFVPHSMSHNMSPNHDFHRITPVSETSRMSSSHMVDMNRSRPPVTRPIQAVDLSIHQPNPIPSAQFSNDISAPHEHSPTPRKRTRLSIDEKIELVKRAKLGLHPTDRMIPARTMRNLLQKADEIEAAANLLSEDERKQRKNFYNRTKQENKPENGSSSSNQPGPT